MQQAHPDRISTHTDRISTHMRRPRPTLTLPRRCARSTMTKRAKPSPGRSWFEFVVYMVDQLNNSHAEKYPTDCDWFIFLKDQLQSPSRGE